MESKIDYDLTDKESIVNHAKRLKGRTLRDFVISGELNLENKGGFGQILERDYFHLENDNSPLPDF